MSSQLKESAVDKNERNAAILVPDTTQYYDLFSDLKDTAGDVPVSPYYIFLSFFLFGARVRTS